MQSNTNQHTELLNIMSRIAAAVAVLQGPEYLHAFINDAYKRIFGEDCRGKSASAIFSGNRLSEILETLRAVQRSGQAAELKEIDIPREGLDSPQYYNFHFAPCLDEKGDVASIVTTLVDVTEQVVARNLSSARESRNHRILNSLPVLVSYLDTDLVYQFVNDAYIGWFDTSLDKILGRPVRSFLSDESWNLVKPLFEQTLRGQALTFERELKYKDGKSRRVSVSYTPDFDASGVVRGLFATVMDVTIEREADRRVRDLADSMTQLAWIAQADGSINWYNQRWYEFTGTTFEDMAAEGWQRFQHPDHIERVVSFIKEAWRKPEPWELTFPMRSAKGEWRWFLTRAVPLKNAQGEVIQWFGTNTEITAERETQKSLQEKTAFLETTLEQMPMGIVFAEAPSGRLFFSNKQTAKVWRHDFIPSQDIQEYVEYIGFHPDGRRFEGKDWPLARTVSEGRAIAEDCDVQVGDGTRRILRVRSAPVRNEKGEMIAAIAMTEDVHEQRMAEEKVKTSEERFRSLVSVLSSVAWTADPLGRFIEPQEQWENYTGHSFEEHKDFGWIKAVHPDDGPSILQNWTAAVAKGSTLTSEGRLWHAATQDYRYFNVRAVPIKDQQGRIKEWVGTVSDVHDRKVAEIELKKAKEEAERANKLKSAFLANMSHEIRTPLGAILGFTDLLKDPETSEDDRSLYLDVIARNGEQLTSIINDILDLSKIEAGEMTIEILQSSPRKIIEEAASLLSVQALEKGLNLKIELDSALPMQVGTDPVRLKQIIFNILGNAIKFTQKGEVVLNASYTRGGNSRDVLILDVRDTGIGISVEQQARLFKAFSQADESTTRRFGGTGLGLTLSKRLAEALGGDVRVLMSVPGEGSQFRIEIEDRMAKTVDEPLEPNAPQQMQKPDADLSQIKVLVVEDSPDNQNLINTILSKANASVTIANNGLEGFEEAVSERYDVVLMDVQMPVMDGYTATQKLREQGFDRPIIALTAHAMSGVHRRCLDAGCTDYLAKPINTRALIEKVSRYASQDRIHHPPSH